MYRDGNRDRVITSVQPLSKYKPLKLKTATKLDIALKLEHW